MPQKNPQTVVDNWANKMSAAGPAYKAAITNLQTNPMQAAAAQQDRMLAGVQAAVASGKWANSLNRVDFNAWKTVTANKGAERLASGATAAKPKMMVFMQKWLPAADAISSAVKTMPKGTREAALARQAAVYDASKAFKASNS